MDRKLYSEIENCIMEVIAQNASVPNFKLPSERMLSLKFNVSREPIRHAYENLIKKELLSKIMGEAILFAVRQIYGLQSPRKTLRSP